MSVPASGFDKDMFRSVMRRQAASVTVITTAYDGRVHGMTATAFCSVSADPPTILIVVNRTARSHALIGGSGIFVVNLLAAEQVELANRFSGKLDDQFTGVDFRIGDTGGPIITGTAAHLECRIVERLEVETHTLFVARVVSGSIGDAEPLVYQNGAYAGLRPL